MRKPTMATAVATATFIGGMGIGSFIAPPMSAFAADTTTEATAAATARTPGQWITDSLKGLVDNGTITQEQSDQVATALKEAKPAGRGGHGGPGRHGGRGIIASDEVANVLGLSVEDLRTQLQTKSLATLAGEKNVNVQTVIDTLVTVTNVRIDQAVTDGKLTQAEADARKANTVARVTEQVNSVRSERFGGKGRHGDDAPSATTTTTTAPAA